MIEDRRLLQQTLSSLTLQETARRDPYLRVRDLHRQSTHSLAVVGHLSWLASIAPREFLQGEKVIGVLVATRSERLAFFRRSFLFRAFEARLGEGCCESDDLPKTANHSHTTVSMKQEHAFVRMYVHRDVVCGCHRVGDIYMYVTCPLLTCR